MEKGTGYDLNRSLLERLVLHGYPYKSLTTQHLMRAEIASYVRRLAHPSLIDAECALERPTLRGAQDSVMFIAHTHGEQDHEMLTDGADGQRAETSVFEADMVVAILRHLARNGYAMDRVVVLTPCLAQLQCLQQALQNSPGFAASLQDMDAGALVRAGVAVRAAGKSAQQRVRLATIGKQHPAYLRITSLISVRQTTTKAGRATSSSCHWRRAPPPSTQGPWARPSASTRSWPARATH